MCNERVDGLPPVEKVMLWSEQEATMKQVTQIGTSACGATSAINALVTSRDLLIYSNSLSANFALIDGPVAHASSLLTVGLERIIFPGGISEKCKYEIERTGYLVAEISREPIGRGGNSQGHSARDIPVNERRGCNEVLRVLSGTKGVLVSLAALLDLQR